MASSKVRIFPLPSQHSTIHRFPDSIELTDCFEIPCSRQNNLPPAPPHIQPVQARVAMCQRLLLRGVTVRSYSFPLRAVLAKPPRSARLPSRFSLWVQRRSAKPTRSIHDCRALWTKKRYWRMLEKSFYPLRYRTRVRFDKNEIRRKGKNNDDEDYGNSVAPLPPSTDSQPAPDWAYVAMQLPAPEFWPSARGRCVQIAVLREVDSAFGVNHIGTRLSTAPMCHQIIKTALPPYPAGLMIVTNEAPGSVTDKLRDSSQFPSGTDRRSA